MKENNITSIQRILYLYSIYICTFFRVSRKTSNVWWIYNFQCVPVFVVSCFMWNLSTVGYMYEVEVIITKNTYSYCIQWPYIKLQDKISYNVGSFVLTSLCLITSMLNYHLHQIITFRLMWDLFSRSCEIKDNRLCYSLVYSEWCNLHAEVYIFNKKINKQVENIWDSVFFFKKYYTSVTLQHFYW